MKKNQTRRRFIHLGLKAGIVLPLAGSALFSCKTDAAEEQTEETPEVVEDKKLSILILGGTSFLGPHQIAYALKNGHSVSTFTRGKTKPSIYKELFAEVEQLIGDRADNLEALRGRKWDAVIDNSGHKAEWTKATAELLKENVGMYLYTSSTGVYYPYLGENITENTDLALKIPDGIEDEYIKGEYGYGVMKANSELEAKRVFGEDRTIVVRPTYMTGPADKTDRFIHWPIRLNRGGRVLVPGKTDDPVQIIDGRDVAEWMIRLIEDKKAGTFNAVGPKAGMTMPEFVQEAHTAFSSEAEFVQVDDYDFLKKQGITTMVPWIMPTGNDFGSARASNQAALSNGLTIRPLQDTVSDMHAWWTSDAVDEERRKKVETEPETVLAKEAEILKTWESRS